MSENDIVLLDGVEIKPEEKKVYIIMNKPIGVISTAQDEHNRKNVIDLLGDMPYRVYPVGRLDYDSSGLILLTNDGDFAYELTHPSHEIEKKYLVKILGIPTKEQLDTLRAGVYIDGYKTRPAFVKEVNIDRKHSVIGIGIHEGRNRQVRKMLESVGITLIALKRVAIGKLELGDIKLGEWRYLQKDELKKIYE